MKKLLILSLVFLCSVALGTAQEDADRAYKKSKRALGSYNLDPMSNAEKLAEAWENIEIALGDATIQQDPESHILRGQIALELANKDLVAKTLDPNAQATYPKIAAEAFASFKKGLAISDKKYHKKDALKGITESINHLNAMAVIGYQLGDNELAHNGFMAVAEAHDLLLKEGENSPLDENGYQDTKFSAAATCGDYSDKAKCNQLLEDLRKANYGNAYIYDLLYNAYIDVDKAKAVTYLDEGRKRFPDEVTLLFTEINHYLKEEKLDELVGKLKLAIEKEPENKSLYLTLGNVYDNLFQRSMNDNKVEEGGKYFEEALNYYKQAEKLDPNYVDVVYSIGALYYNRAAIYTQELNALADDLSKAGMAKYDAMKVKVDQEFVTALPYFRKAESLNPDDINTLIALREIFARQNKIELSNEFKKRLENVQANGTNSASYFKE